MLFLPVVPKVYILGSIFAIIANTCFGASFVLLNSFLPLLVRHHPTVQYAAVSSDSSYTDEERSRSNESIIREAHYSNELAEEENVLDGVADATTALLPRARTEPDLTVPNPRSNATPSQELALSTKISSYGIAIGYIAALLVQTISIVIVILLGSSNFGLRLVLFINWCLVVHLYNPRSTLAPSTSWPTPPHRLPNQQFPNHRRILHVFLEISWSDRETRPSSERSFTLPRSMVPAF